MLNARRRLYIADIAVSPSQAVHLSVVELSRALNGGLCKPGYNLGGCANAKQARPSCPDCGYRNSTVRILVTNDDGVNAPGIAHLARFLAKVGHDVVVIAPLQDSSGAGAGVGPVHQFGGISYERIEIPGLDAPAYGIDGLPAMAVIAGCLGGFGDPPEIVVSGINLGLNAGFSVLHSGTVGAALTGTHFNVSALAVSIEWAADLDSVHWDTASVLASYLVGSILEGPPSTVLNLNVPNRALGELRGMSRADLAASGTIRSAVDQDGEGYLQLALGRRGGSSEAGTDVGLVEQGFASLTAIRSVSEDPRRIASEFVEGLAGSWVKEPVDV